MEEITEKENVNQLKWLLKNPLEATLCALLIGIVLVTFIQVLFRYIFHLSLAWSEELARYMFLWVATLTAAYAFKTGSHFALRVVVDKLGPKTERVFQFIVALLVSIFLVIFTWKSIEYTYNMRNQVAPSTGISMAIPYASAIVGGALMLYYVVTNWLKAFRGQDVEELNQ
jgi:TRAP-type transport system small permease protein